MFQRGFVVAQRYEIEQFVGKGGMGEVYAATDQMTGRRVALKTVLCTATDDLRAVRKLLDEVVNAQRVAHPHVGSGRACPATAGGCAVGSASGSAECVTASGTAECVTAEYAASERGSAGCAPSGRVRIAGAGRASRAPDGATCGSGRACCWKSAQRQGQGDRAPGGGRHCK